MNNYSQWMRRNRRNLGTPLVLIALILAGFHWKFLWISLSFVCIGEAIRIWSAGHLRKEEVMTTGGPYRMIRNPLYLGSFLIAIGFCFIAGSIWIWILMFAYFLLCYIPVIRFEENTLREKFADQYQQYAAVIPAFYPTIHLYPQSSTTFSMNQVLRNKEYNSVIGIILIYAILFLKAKFLTG